MKKILHKLKSEMFANDVDQIYLCKQLRKSKSYMTSRMSGIRPFDISEIYQICDLLEIPYNEIADYFPKSDLTGTI